MPDFVPPASPIRAAAFDMDGTIASSEDVYLRVGGETLRRRGKTFEDDLRHAMMGRVAPKALQVMIDWHALPDTVESLVAESEELFWQFAPECLRAMPGVERLLDALDARDLPRGIVTSGGREYAERILAILGLAERFAFVISANDVENSKPHPEPYERAAKRFGLNPGAMLVLEDSAVGCRSAVAAGAYTVAVPNEHTGGHAFDGAALIARGLEDPRILAAVDHPG